MSPDSPYSGVPTIINGGGFRALRSGVFNIVLDLFWIILILGVGGFCPQYQILAKCGVGIRKNEVPYFLALTK